MAPLSMGSPSCSPSRDRRQSCQAWDEITEVPSSVKTRVVMSTAFRAAFKSLTFLSRRGTVNFHRDSHTFETWLCHHFCLDQSGFSVSARYPLMSEWGTPYVSRVDSHASVTSAQKHWGMSSYPAAYVKTEDKKCSFVHPFWVTQAQAPTERRKTGQAEMRSIIF